MIPPAVWDRAQTLGTCLIVFCLAAVRLPISHAAEAAPGGSRAADLELLRETARHVLEAAKVPAGASIPQGPTNTTAFTLRVPGGTQNYYPAFWEHAQCEKGKYQNGGYWATPAGWFIVALGKVNSAAADQVLTDYAAHLRRYRTAGAPWEWIQPQRHLQVNALIGSSAGLVSIALSSEADGR